MFTCALVPTGRYFIDVGSMDSLVVGYWLVLGFAIVLVRCGFYLLRLHFKDFKVR